jgi:hypothetical protein
VTGERCPVCGGVCGFGRIGDYERNVIELYPYSKERISIARFRCGIGGGTFSMLPYQLVPYHQYTLESMVFALLLWREMMSESGTSSSGYAVSGTLSFKSFVSSSHLYSWLAVLCGGLRRRHSEMSEWAELTSVRFGRGTAQRLEEFYEYASVLCPRGPPRQEALHSAAIRYGLESGGFLVGTPSQARRRGASR